MYKYLKKNFSKNAVLDFSEVCDYFKGPQVSPRPRTDEFENAEFIVYIVSIISFIILFIVYTRDSD